MKSTRLPASEWRWYGYPGHFICGARCVYHLSTRIGKFLISTVGDFRPRTESDHPHPIGAGADSLFETYVFHCDGETPDGDPNVTDWSEIDGERYATSIAAERGHYTYCEKYAELAGSHE